MNELQPISTPVTVVEKYANQALLRAAVQAVPYVGSVIDGILSGKASQIQMSRIDSFIALLSERLSRIETAGTDVDGDAFSDLVTTAIEKAARARSEEKRSRFAQIVANQTERGVGWEEPEAAIRLLSELDDVHMAVLNAALTAPAPTAGAFKDLRVASMSRGTFAAGDAHPRVLIEFLPTYGATALRLACAELLARGLLHDEGVGRWGGGPMEYFVATELAKWFSDWVSRAA